MGKSRGKKGSNTKSKQHRNMGAVTRRQAAQPIYDDSNEEVHSNQEHIVDVEKQALITPQKKPITDYID